MDIKDLYSKVLDLLPDSPSNSSDWHGFWSNKHDQEIMCESDTQADALADFFEDLGFDVMHTHHYNYGECLVNEDCYGWWSVYPD